MISLCEKVRLQQLRKAKCSILASISDIFQKNFLTEPHTCLYSTLCKSHDFLISCFQSGHIFSKVWLFGKIHFIILFWTRSLVSWTLLYWSMLRFLMNSSVLFVLETVILFTAFWEIANTSLTGVNDKFTFWRQDAVRIGWMKSNNFKENKLFTVKNWSRLLTPQV